MLVQPQVFPSLSDASQRRSQQGFSLIEVSIVSAIILLLAIIAIPAIHNYVVENRVPKVGETLARFIVQTQVNSAGAGTTPYTNINTQSLGNGLGEAGIMAVSGSGASTVVSHGLGGDGDVVVASTSGGKQFTVTLSKVSHAACPGISSVLQRVVQGITVTSASGPSATLKSASQAYTPMLAETSCGKGNVNTFVFTVG